MPFLGSQPADQYQSLAKQTITGDGSTSYTLNRSVTNEFDIEVFINNVRQEPTTSYSATGNTITFTAAVTASDSCYLIYQGQSVGTVNPPTNSVGETQIQNGSVTHSKFHTNALDPIKLSGNNVGIGTSSPSNFGGSTLQVNHASSYSSVLASSGAYTMQFMASQANGVTNMGSRSNHPVSITTNDTPQLTIDTSGRVTVPNQPGFRAGRTGNYTPGSGVDIVFNTTSAGGMFNDGGHYSTSTGRFTAPVAGKYFFTTMVIWGPSVPNNTSMTDSFRFAINGTVRTYSNRRGYYVNGITGDGGYFVDTSTDVFKLSAGDYVTVYSQRNLSVHGNDQYTIFSGFLLG